MEVGERNDQVGQGKQKKKGAGILLAVYFVQICTEINGHITETLTYSHLFQAMARHQLIFRNGNNCDTFEVPFILFTLMCLVVL